MRGVEAGMGRRARVIGGGRRRMKKTRRSGSDTTKEVGTTCI